MKRIDQAALAEYVDRYLAKHVALLDGRSFRGKVTAVSGSYGSWQVQIQRTGEAASDGAWYPVVDADYVPVVGDVIDLQWRDRNTAIVIGPIPGGAMSGGGALRTVGSVSGAAPTSGAYIIGDMAFDTKYQGWWLCTVAGSPGTWVLLQAARAMARVHLAGGFLLPNATDTLIKCDTVDDDPNSNYSAATGLYTCPVAGRYLILGQMRANTAAAGWFTVNVYKNASSGTPQYFGASTAQNGGLNPTVGINRVIRCNATDTLGISAYQTSGGNQTLDVGSESCFLHVTHLGP